MIDTWMEMESCGAGQRLHHHSIRITETLSGFPAVRAGYLRYHGGVKMIPGQESPEIPHWRLTHVTR